MTDQPSWRHLHFVSSLLEKSKPTATARDTNSTTPAPAPAPSPTSPTNQVTPTSPVKKVRPLIQLLSPSLSFYPNVTPSRFQSWLSDEWDFIFDNCYLRMLNMFQLKDFSLKYEVVLVKQKALNYVLSLLKCPTGDVGQMFPRSVCVVFFF